MLEIFALLIAGVVIGWLIRRRSSWVRAAERLMTGFVYLMLFLLGVGMGADPGVIGNVRSLGLHAFGLALFALTGSIAAGLICSHLVFRRHER
ncbi:MAG TPA: LysO family transporter [Syntrophales bacterium]|nr:LysO family transporter [Syntrophales bacterium]HOG08578.1 LysO family transporter [Syntrophales bacterium]